jgi:hypothetical protein
MIKSATIRRFWCTRCGYAWEMIHPGEATAEIIDIAKDSERTCPACSGERQWTTDNMKKADEET